jgi:hypothetical protein
LEQSQEDASETFAETPTERVTETRSWNSRKNSHVEQGEKLLPRTSVAELKQFQQHSGILEKKYGFRLFVVLG